MSAHLTICLQPPAERGRYADPEERGRHANSEERGGHAWASAGPCVGCRSMMPQRSGLLTYHRTRSPPPPPSANG
eukprot:288544-Chlamydomonas_euryale.AAC.2